MIFYNEIQPHRLMGEGREELQKLLVAMGLPPAPDGVPDGVLGLVAGAGIAVGLRRRKIEDSDDSGVIEAKNWPPVSEVPFLKQQHARMSGLIQTVADQCCYKKPITIGISVRQPLGLGAGLHPCDCEKHKDLAMVFYGPLLPICFTDFELAGGISHEISHLFQQRRDKDEMSLADQRAEEIEADEFSGRMGFAANQLAMLTKYRLLDSPEALSKYGMKPEGVAMLNRMQAEQDPHEAYADRVKRLQNYITSVRK